jgi:hypothetical protein
MREQRVVRLVRWQAAPGRVGKIHAGDISRTGSVQTLCHLAGIVGGNCTAVRGEKPDCRLCRRLFKRIGARVEGTL